MMKRLSTRWLLTMGLTSIVVSLLMLAQLIGLAGDSQDQATQGRARVSEAIAAAVVGQLGEETGDGHAQAYLDFIRGHNPELLSAGVRRADGSLRLTSGEHPARWAQPAGEHSTPEAILVPLHAEGKRWGQLELRFESLRPDGILGWFADERLRLLGFMSLCCTLAFYLYLRRMLRHLDPSRAVPERVRTAFDTLSEGLILTDAQGQILMANRSFSGLVGVEATQLVGRSVDDFRWTDRADAVLDDAQRPWRCALQQAAAQLQFPLSLVDARGQQRHFQANCAPIMSVGSEPGGVLISLQDVTQLEQIQDELRTAKGAAETANRAKSEFLANMSHEIRTPMNAILGFTEVLRRGIHRDPKTTRKHLDTIHRNGRNLLDLINDILDLSKVESGNLEIESVESEPHRIAMEVVEALGIRAQAKGIGLRFLVDGKVPAGIATDATRLRQIITNLTGNAIKFTSRGEVVVMERWITRTNPPQLRIEIRDSGIGIPADKLSAIFDPFVQAEGSTTRRFGGTGLGLSISRKFARAMGGDVTVSSRLNEGSTFTITLPVADGAQRRLIEASEAMVLPEAASAPGARTWRFDGQRVLVVDDSPENRELVRVVLQDAGLRVEEASNGREAVHAVSSEPFDLVLMDVHMPEMDGYAAVRMLRAQGVELPIMAFTADALQGFEVEIMQAGFSGYLTKPVDIEVMLALLKDYLRTVEGAAVDTAAAPFEDVPVLSARVDGAATISLSALADRGAVAGEHDAGDDEPPIVSTMAGHPRLGPVIQIFLKRLPQQIDALRGAYEQRDWAKIAEVAHMMKGAAGSLGFDAFTQPTKRLEQQARAGDIEGMSASLEQIYQLARRTRRGAELQAQQMPETAAIH